MRVLAAALALVAAASTFAQTYPEKPVRIIVPYAAGGTTDVMARVVGQRMGEAMGQPFVVENRTGAGGIVGMEMAHKSAHDGYTILMMPPNLSTLHALYGKLPFDPLKDFAPIVLVGVSPIGIAVHPSKPYRTIGELVAYAKANPGKVNYASCGAASPQHIAGEYLKSVAGIDIQHINYKGCGQATPDVLSGTIDVFFATVPNVVQHFKSGKLRGLGITGKVRSPNFPDLPTVAESGYPSYYVETWFGLIAPAGVPRPIVARLNAEANKALQRADVREKMAEQAFEPVGGTPEAFGAIIKADYERFGELIPRAGIKAD